MLGVLGCCWVYYFYHRKYVLRHRTSQCRKSSKKCRKVPKDNQKMSKNTANKIEESTELPEVDPQIEAQKAEIIDVLWSDEKKTAEIIKGVERPEKSVRLLLNDLVSEGRIVRVKSGLYRLSPELAPWSESKNEKIIDALMKLYEKVLEQYLQKGDISLNDFKSLILMVDRLMKRWYLVHRGYDSNTKQAEEDVKQKTENREKQALEGLPPEEQLEVVGDYDVEMRVLLESLPEPVKKEVTV